MYYGLEEYSTLGAQFVAWLSCFVGFVRSYKCNESLKKLLLDKEKVTI